MSLPSYFTFSVSDPDETDLVLVSLHDSRTNFTVRTALPNSGKQTASIMAFAGARYSRADISALELFKEIKDAKKSANEKLATIFRQYGHASVADMAQLFAYIENIPQILAWKFFYSTSLGGGQERSTRYQDFSGSQIQSLKSCLTLENQENVEAAQNYPKLNQEFENLQQIGLDFYQKWVSTLTEKYTQVYNIDPENKKHVGALTARVFDSARYFLPSGACNRTSLAYITSAREWARLISIFKADSNHQLKYLAEQLEILFAPEEEVAAVINYTPEASELIRYTATAETQSKALNRLSDFIKLQGLDLDSKPASSFRPISVKLVNLNYSGISKAIAQNILTIYPNLEFEEVLEWISALTQQQKLDLSETLFAGFNHHQQLPGQYQSNNYTFILTQAIAESRDLNRHRAWGRFTPFLEIQSDFIQLLDIGYHLPAYINDNPKLDLEKEDFVKDLESYYKELYSFSKLAQKCNWFPEYLLLQLLPFAHSADSFMHGSVKEFAYLSSLRTTPGCHINVRQIIYQMNQLLIEQEPLLTALNVKKAPNSLSSEEFVDRS